MKVLLIHTRVPHKLCPSQNSWLLHLIKAFRFITVIRRARLALSAARSLHWRFRPTRQGGRRYRSARRYRSPCRRSLQRRVQTPATVCRYRGTFMRCLQRRVQTPAKVCRCRGTFMRCLQRRVRTPAKVCRYRGTPATARRYRRTCMRCLRRRVPTQVSGPAPQTRAPRRPRPAPQRDRAARRRGGTADRRDCGPVRLGVEAPHISLGLGADGGGRAR